MTQTHYDDRVTNESWRTVMIAFSALVIFMLLICGTVPAKAGERFHPQFIQGEQPLCGPRDELLKDLAKSFKEVPVGAGLVSNGSLLELLSAPDGKTWTAMITRPDGISCLVAAGESWQQDRIAKTGELGS